MDDCVAITLHGNADFRAGPAAHPRNRVLKVVWLYRIGINRNNLVAAANISSGGWRPGQWRYNNDRTVFLADLDTNTGVTTGSTNENIPVFVRVQILRMRVQVANHASNRAFQQHIVVDRLNEILFDALHDLDQQAGLVGDRVIVIHRCLPGYHSAAQRQAKAHYGTDNQNQNSSGFQ